VSRLSLLAAVRRGQLEQRWRHLRAHRRELTLELDDRTVQRAATADEVADACLDLCQAVARTFLEPLCR
jgi:hypothetical protein